MNFSFVCHHQDITPIPSAQRAKHLPFLPIELLDEVSLRLRAMASLAQHAPFQKLADDIKFAVSLFCK